ncbi:hypothetical protein KHP62_11855 [Rhodobacteraceae bacterium NNCM2]|nr:hypothetical protein [Coraliihabitans acroporae]
MSGDTNRPPKPPPLRRGDDLSMAEWRAYMEACALADSELLRQKGSLNDRMN